MPADPPWSPAATGGGADVRRGPAPKAARRSAGAATREGERRVMGTPGDIPGDTPGQTLGQTLGQTPGQWAAIFVAILSFARKLSTL